MLDPLLPSFNRLTRSLTEEVWLARAAIIQTFSEDKFDQICQLICFARQDSNLQSPDGNLVP